MVGRRSPSGVERERDSVPSGWCVASRLILKLQALPACARASVTVFLTRSYSMQSTRAMGFHRVGFHHKYVCVVLFIALGEARALGGARSDDVRYQIGFVVI